MTAEQVTIVWYSLILQRDFLIGMSYLISQKPERMCQNTKSKFVKREFVK